MRRYITNILYRILPGKLNKEDKMGSTRRIHNEKRNGYTSVAGKYQRNI
jgi:hypothetical protein